MYFTKDGIRNYGLADFWKLFPEFGLGVMFPYTPSTGDELEDELNKTTVEENFATYMEANSRDELTYTTLNINDGEEMSFGATYNSEAEYLEIIQTDVIVELLNNIIITPQDLTVSNIATLTKAYVLNRNNFGDYTDSLPTGAETTDIWFAFDSVADAVAFLKTANRNLKITTGSEDSKIPNIAYLKNYDLKKETLLNEKIGYLSRLKTNSKNSLVDAINEMAVDILGFNEIIETLVEAVEQIQNALTSDSIEDILAQYIIDGLVDGIDSEERQAAIEALMALGKTQEEAEALLDEVEEENNLVVEQPIDTHTYGASWDGSSSTTWTRTDDAVGFSNPNPYYSDMTTTPSSPFDNISPWKDMTVETIDGNSLVKIPKFYYKLEQNGTGMKIQISNGAQDGFSVSPAHMDRGDGKGVRDVAYIGRYHCASDYKSKSGVRPLSGITRSTARTNIHNLGTGFCQSDFAMRFTLWLLYIVEFANWDSQACIGYGCSPSGSKVNMGYTDGMSYHTGTTATSRTTYGGTQYRNIEGLWDNVYDWMDGCYYNSNGLNVILNPNNFNDNSNGTSIGTPSNGYPSVFSVKNVSGTFPTFIPSTSSGSNSTYSCDSWSFDSSFPCLCVGGNYGQSSVLGLFYVSCSSSTSSVDNLGCRLLYIP